MGGYGCGRKRRHVLTTECFQIDTSRLKKHLRQPGRYTGEIKDKEACMSFMLEHFAQEARSERLGAHWPVSGKLTLFYTVTRDAQTTEHIVSLPLVTTPCTYGGQRWWIVSPCCGDRVRIVYLSHETNIPQCRHCLGLHYPSQCASSKETHIALEKLLLRNYGYPWAQHEYHSMKEHFFKITPHWEEVRQRSILTCRYEMLYRLIKEHRAELRSHLNNLKWLKSDQDRAMYLEGIVKNHGLQYATNLALMAGIIPSNVSEGAREGQRSHSMVFSFYRLLKPSLL